MIDKAKIYEGLLPNVKAIIEGSGSREKKLQRICDLLRREVPYFDWVGFYLTDAENPDDLVLGPFNGAPTEHVRISVGTGICGRAAHTRRMFVVQDVSKETNYLACSPTDRSEIVVLIRDSFGGVLGQIDADSSEVGAFDHTDEMLLESVATKLAAFARRRGGTQNKGESRSGGG